MSIRQTIADKKRWRRYKARKERLPGRYRIVVDALQRYVFSFASSRSDPLMSLLEDLADLFEESAADNTGIRAIVGDDPVEFAETFLRNYPEGQWISRERERLTATIDRAAGGGNNDDERTS